MILIINIFQIISLLCLYKQSGHLGKDHPSILSSAISIYRGNGYRGFYNGLSLNWIKGFIAAGIAFSVNEQLKDLQYR